MIEVRPYTGSDRERWDTFVRDAKNGHFMFMRDYMEYHAARFDDHSLLFEEKGKLVALLPANSERHTLLSHGGLTFGGIVSGSGMTTSQMLKVFSALQNYCREHGFSNVVYKAIPYIYSCLPAQEDLYALYVHQARLVRRDVSASLVQDGRPDYSSRQKRNINKARRQSYSVQENPDYTAFWSLLNQVLSGRHGVHAVHTLDEIQRLAGSFPRNIRLFEVRDADGNLLAGTLLYISNRVVHTQYLANSDAGRKTGALDYLIDELVNLFRDKRYFDFGISTTDAGLVLNEGLCTHKEGFGARAVVHDFYELAVT